MHNLDILHLPLYGFRLIEASAGTGKTHNLIIIYLRLLLNINTQLNLSYKLTVKSILVVTFTKAASYELRLRIKNSIKQLRIDCMQGYSNNDLFSKLLSQINDIKSAIETLSTAEKEIDQASIFTIHGFCQKILTENKIELSMLFHTSIIENTSQLYQEICNDFWRHHFYPLPLNITSFIQKFWKNPEELFHDISPYINSNPPKFQHNTLINELNENITTFYNNIINCINNVKIQWINTQHNIINTIELIQINRKIYNKNNLKRWINIINQWTQKQTLDHSIPNYLNRFRSSILKLKKNLENSHIFSLYFNIEILYQKLSLFPALIFKTAISEIYQNLNKTKYFRSEITFHDLVEILLEHIYKNHKLSQKILKSYPITIIDEFQDTDINQYKIFQKLYSNTSKNNGLILIGDPKQAIYSFRGADIFTYIKIRRLLPNKYNLNINWRSSSGMINAINQLFQTSNPFIFKDITFIPSKPAYQNRTYKFYLHNMLQESINFWLHPDDTVTMYHYKKSMTHECINNIQNLVHSIHNKTAWLEHYKYKKKPLQQSDLTVLVRNHEEATLIRSELLKINIPTVFLSNRKNIFNTIESYELLLLLQAILYPNKNTICTALTTIFLGFKATQIEILNNSSGSQWKEILEEFSKYYLIWKQYNIFSMIQKIIFDYNIPEKLLSMQFGKNTLINILHLGEILNNTAKQLKNKHALIQWLKLKIQSSDKNELLSEYALRYDNQDNLIQISTIHYSKGLEFPITFLPFAANFRYNKNILFHDRKWFELYLEFDKSELSSQLSDQERLADDLRLLYVAITRSIYHCSIGIAPIIYKNHKYSNNITDFHQSAIGYLIQQKKPGTAELLKKRLHTLKIDSNGDINFRIISKKQNPPYYTNYKLNKLLFPSKWDSTITKKYDNSWRITSYSELKQIYDTKVNINSKNLLKLITQNNFCEKSLNFKILTPHTFPTGIIYGNFFHNLFKNLDFKKSINVQWLQTQMILHNIKLSWITIIKQWIYTIINTPLDKHYLTLSKIHNKYKKTELKFCLNINKKLQILELNHICKHYDPLSNISTIITYETITGILKGFIDLVFFWKKQYYLLDYKTNRLGNNHSAYTKVNMESEIIKYHYDLQYQIYTLALHRFLKNKITSYDYNKDFGGVYYLFIRGMDGLSSNNGIYFCRPNWEFINKLDTLF